MNRAFVQKNELKMIDEEMLAARLQCVGYERVQPLTYMARSPSLEVEHFIYFVPFSSAGQNLTIEYGLRNPQAEEFSFSCMRRYGGRWAERLEYDSRCDSSTRFDFSALNPMSESTPLLLPKLLTDTSVEFVVGRIIQDLLPFARGIASLSALYATLVDDDARASWSLTTNGAMRAAQAVSIGRRLNFDPITLVSDLEPRTRWIEAVLQSGRPTSFLNAIIADWDDGIWNRQLQGHST